jgi:hypothetical protein
VKSELASLSLSQDSCSTSWEGIVQTIAQDAFAAAFQQWMERSEKCMQISSNHVKK